MPILDQLRRGVDTAKFKADQLMRINRVQGEIGNIRREIQATREKIANAAIELHQKSALSHQELEGLCIAIDGLSAQIAEKEAQIGSIRAEMPPQSYVAKSVNPCPNCYFDVPIGAAFCPNCGKAMPQPSEQPVAEVVHDAEKCTNCGTVLSAEAEFCTNCGQRVVQASQPSDKES
jgi:rRNA maturation endonuclease Nob1